MFRCCQQFAVSLGLMAGLLCLCVSPVAIASFATELSQEQIEQVLETYFPINEYAAIARVSMHTPQVRLQKGEKRLVLLVPVEANVVGGGKQKGHATVAVKLTYKSPSGGLYFAEPEILQFDMPGVDKKTSSALREIVDAMNQTSLPLVRIYAVKESDLNHSLAKSVLKSLEIEDSRLKLLFGFD